MPKTVITLPCTARELEAALHSYCDHHGAWGAKINFGYGGCGYAVHLTLSEEGSGETSPSPSTPAPTDNAAIRKALDAIAHTASMIVYTAGIGSKVATMATQIIDEAAAVLTLPPRQCDVGTAEEQIERFNHQCFEHHTGRCSRNCKTLPAKTFQACALKWAQMTYKKEGVK